MLKRKYSDQINREIAHGIVARILEDLIIDDKLDAKIPLEFGEPQAVLIAKHIEALMNAHVANSLKAST